MTSIAPRGSSICQGFNVRLVPTLCVGTRVSRRSASRLAAERQGSVFPRRAWEQEKIMSDSTTTVAELRNIVADFVAERDWSQFHAPKNVSMALAIEAAELMEHFQWLTTEASRELADDPAKLAEVGEELADVIGYSFALANELGLNVSSAIRAKMVKNAQKYPADKYRGKYERPKKT